MGGDGPAVGFACCWEPERARTWSHIPWHLLGALQQQAPGRIVDLGPDLPTVTRAGLRALATRRADGRWVSPWKHTAATDLVIGRSLRRALRRSPCDTVVEVHDLAMVDAPYLVFQDLSYQVLLDLWEEGGALQVGGLDLDRVRRRRDRQQAVYARAAGIIAMSRWFADHLVQRSGVDPQRVSVAYAGISVASADPVAPPRPADERHRLLFVGRDFERKGGRQVVEAVRHLRRHGQREVTLTIVGPSALPAGIDADADGVAFLGPLDHDGVLSCLRSHDLFVMPSLFEAFGIAFAEALSQGVPCVARDAFAMPEVVRPGHNGALVSTSDPLELAAAIEAALMDDHLHDTAHREAAEVAERFSWTACARTVLAAAEHGATAGTAS